MRCDHPLHSLHELVERVGNSYIAIREVGLCLLVFFPAREVNLIPAGAHHRAWKRRRYRVEERAHKRERRWGSNAELAGRWLGGVLGPGRLGRAGDMLRVRRADRGCMSRGIKLLRWSGVRRRCNVEERKVPSLLVSLSGARD